MKFSQILCLGILRVLDTFIFRLVAGLGLCVVCLPLVSHLYARSSIKNQSHYSFQVAVFQSDGTFTQVNYSTNRDFKPENTSFLAKFPSGQDKSSDGNYSFSYKVLKEEPQLQLIEIETIDLDDDRNTWATYVATADTIMPLSTRIETPGYLLLSALIAFILVQLMKQFIRYLRWSIIMPIYSDTQNDYTKKDME